MNGLRIRPCQSLLTKRFSNGVYGQFSYTRKSHEADLGVMKLELKEKETVNVPAWAGIAAIAAGTALLLVRRRG